VATPRDEPIKPMTLGNMRQNGVRGLDVTCQHCDHQPHRNRGLSAAELMQRRATEEAAHEAAGAAQEAAQRVVERWNAERSSLWSPTIRCAITAGTPWVDVYCPVAIPVERSISAPWTATRSRRSAAL
jgi:hypothetical protein